MADEWQDIESAPRDGTSFLAYFPDSIGNDSWNITRCWLEAGARLRWHTPEADYDVCDPEAPTHWRPLPAPPVRQPQEVDA